MTAKEMFEKLGFEKYESPYALHWSIYPKTGYKAIIFLKDYKKYKLKNIAGVYMTLHKAICKQLEELGWLDEQVPRKLSKAN